MGLLWPSKVSSHLGEHGKGSKAGPFALSWSAIAMMGMAGTVALQLVRQEPKRGYFPCNWGHGVSQRTALVTISHSGVRSVVEGMVVLQRGSDDGELGSRVT